MPKVATEADYIKFKEFLRFFVRQAEKNAKNRGAERPTKNMIKDVRVNPDFWRHYGLARDFHKIAGVDFIMRFFMVGNFGTERSTYINVGIFNIIGKFINERIVALRNTIILNVPNLNFRDDFIMDCKARNNSLVGFRSIEDLGIDRENNDPPNDLLKSMLDEFLKIYNDLYERSLQHE